MARKLVRFYESDLTPEMEQLWKCGRVYQTVHAEQYTETEHKDGDVQIWLAPFGVERRYVMLDMGDHYAAVRTFEEVTS